MEQNGNSAAGDTPSASGESCLELGAALAAGLGPN